MINFTKKNNFLTKMYDSRIFLTKMYEKKMYEKKCMKMYEKKKCMKMYESRMTSRRGTTAIAPASTTLLTGLTLP